MNAAALHAGWSPAGRLSPRPPAERLASVDTATNRLLLWPLSAGKPGDSAAAVIGQENLAASGENHGHPVAADSLRRPYGVCGQGDRLAVADSGNNRVMLWRRRR
jgi:hypothetical protein